MCGRSVLGGWFDHWGWDYDPGNPVRFGQYYLVYREMDVPPGITDSAADAARAAAAAGGETMFFKLCFVDFAGGDEYSARENLQGNAGYRPRGRKDRGGGGRPDPYPGQCPAHGA